MKIRILRCDHCHELFGTSNKGRKARYCSKLCKNRARRPRMPKASTTGVVVCTCVVCEQSFKAKRSNRRTCSAECRRQWQNQRSKTTRANGIPTPCFVCGRVFNAHPQRASECCSWKCARVLCGRRKSIQHTGTCLRCGEATRPRQRGRSNGMCVACHDKDVAELKFERMRKQVDSLFGVCGDCGNRFRYARNKSRSRCCECRLKHIQEVKRALRKEAKTRRRARKKGATIERFTASELFNRDGWKCQLCGRRVRKFKVMNHPREATIDHIIPLSRGGKHSLVNCQTACRQCNSCKGAKVKGQHRLPL